MKAKKLVIFFFVLGLLVTGCSRSFKCQCFTSGNEYPIGDVPRSEADAICETYEDDPFNGNCAVVEE